MSRLELLSRLAALRPWLESQGVVRLRLFGSFARDGANDESDIDLIVDLNRPMGLAFYQLEHELGVRLGRTVELVTEAGLAPDIRFSALRDAVDA
jgi:uncharacterized protein